MLHDLLEGAVLAHELQGSGWTDAFDGVDIVASKENAEVDKLSLSSAYVVDAARLNTYLLALHIQSFQHFVEMDFQDRLFPLLTEREMS